MPSYLRGPANKRDKMTFVAINASNLHFGWNAKDLTAKTGIGTGDLVALGHINAAQMAAVSGGLAIMGANSPRPPRMKKVINPGTTSPDVQESVSTFCAYDAIAQALAAGWKPAGNGKLLPSIRTSSRSVTAAASVDFGGGIIGYYLFPMNAADAALPQIATLGLKFAGAGLSDAEIKKAFSGASQPRPFTAELKLEGGATKSAFCSHDKTADAAAAGWSIGGGANPPVMNS